MGYIPLREGNQPPKVDTAALLSLGFAIFPMPAGIKLSGQMGFPGHTQASTDPNQIASWLAHYGACNWGIEATRSRLIVVDIDNKPHKNLPIDLTRATFDAMSAREGDTQYYAPTAQTPSGGQHIYFRLPRGFSANSQPELAHGIDIRAHNGYVVAPGSVFYGEQGSEIYSWAGNVYTAPSWLISHCQRELGTLEHIDLGGRLLPSGVPGDVLAGHAKSFIAHQCRRLIDCDEGGRNNLLNEICNNVMPFYHEATIDPDEIVSMLQDAAIEAGLGDFETNATIQSGIGIGRSLSNLQTRMSPDHPALRLVTTVQHICAMPRAAVAPAGETLIETPIFGTDFTNDDFAPQEGYMHGLTHPDMVTILTGEPGTGKTSFMALLACASVCDEVDAGEENGSWPLNLSSMLYLGYEGTGAFKVTVSSLIKNRGWTEKYPERFKMISVGHRNQIVFEGEQQGRPVINEAFIKQIRAKIEEMLPTSPNGRLTLAVDNMLHACDNTTAVNYAKYFMGVCKDLAHEYNISIIVMSHPPKGGEGVYGSYAFEAAADICREIKNEKISPSERLNWLMPRKCRVTGPNIYIRYATKLPQSPVYEVDVSGLENRPVYKDAKLREAYVAYVSGGGIDWEGPDKGREEVKGELVKVPTTTTSIPPVTVAVAPGMLAAPQLIPGKPPDPPDPPQLTQAQKDIFKAAWEAEDNGTMAR